MVRKHFGKRNKGFSLVELLVAVTLLVIAATAFLPAFTFAIRSNNHNKIRSTANSIATSIFEEISSMKYEDIGTAGGSPSGTVPKEREITVDNVKYKVETQITWGSTLDLNDNPDAPPKTNYLAYKNVRVVVKAEDPFTTSEDIIDKMYSIVAKEGEQSLPDDKGNMRVLIKDANNKPHETLSLNISATGPRSYSMITDTGEVVFGEIDKGQYSVTVPVPAGYAVPQNEIIESGSVKRFPVLIDNWNVKEVVFCMDKSDKFANLAIRLVDEDGEVIDSPGTITLSWEFDDVKKDVFTDKAFSEGDIPASTIGRLWPLGKYNIVITFPYSAGYINYNMSTAVNKPIIEGTGEEWDGTFSSPGESLNIIVPVEEGLNIEPRNAFDIIEAESYDNTEANYTLDNADGGRVIRNIGSGEYALYKYVDFSSGSFKFSARARGSDRVITIRIDSIDGPVIGILNFKSSGTSYNTQSCYINGITGVHDLYLVFNGDISLNWFTFGKLYDFDNFNDNSISPAWLFKNGSWSEANGYLMQTSTAVADPKKAILYNCGFDDSTDYTIKAKVMVPQNTWTNNEDMARAGVSLFTDPVTGQGYNLLFHSTYKRVQFLDDFQGWSGNFSFNWSTGTWYWFMLKSEGRNLYGKVWRDGQQEPATWSFTWTAPTERRGYPALNGGSGHAAVWFDEVYIYTD